MKYSALLWTFSAALGLNWTPATSQNTAGPIAAGDAELRRLTGAERLDHDATWSPDGEWIVFISRDENDYTRLWKVSTRGGESQQLTRGEEAFFDWYPHWSPDGKRIAFASTRGDEAHIWTIAADGGEPTRITAQGLGLPITSCAPSWSPDGRSIAYTARVDDNTDIYVIAVDGSEARRITHHPTFDRLPGWSPDGSELIFSSNRDRDGDEEDEEGGYLWTIGVDGGDAHPLDVVPHASQWGRWSPDGRWLAYQTREESSTNAGMWIVAAGGGEPIPVATLDSLGGWTPQWSPDGEKIAYTSGFTRAGRLAVIPVEGGEATILVDSVSYRGPPRWSHDGETIVYSSDEGKIWEVPTAGGQAQVLLEGSGKSVHPHLSPDGSQIVYKWDNEEEQNIWVVDIAGGEPEPLTLGAEPKSWPVWSADGETITFTAGRVSNNNVDVWMVDAAGGRPVKLTHHPGIDGYSFWLPGGQEIGFMSNRNWNGMFRWDILAVDANGGEPRVFYSGKTANGNLWWPAISPDGRYLAYSSSITLLTSMLYLVSLEDDVSRVLDTRGVRPAFSPDGRRIAYYKSGPSRHAIWIADVSRIVGSIPKL